MVTKSMRWFVVGLLVTLVFSLAVISSPSQAADNVRVLVGFQGPPDAAVIHSAGGQVHRVFNLLPVIAATVPSQAIQGLQHNPKIEYIEHDRVLKAVVDVNTPQTVPWGITKIAAPTVWPTNTGVGVKVAVLDSGIDATHPDLSANYAGGYDFLDNDDSPNDLNGHGTHVSGTIAAENNLIGVVGVSPGVELYSLKFLDASGSGYSSDAIAGIQWAVNNGIQVLNMSYGSYFSNRTEKSALDKAYAAGMLLVAAAGNDGNTLKLYPAAYSSVMAVAATDLNNNRASFSSYYSDVEIAAPGVGINSTLPTYSVYLNTEYGYDSNYDELNGTSMATPHVSGAAALVFASDTNLSNVDVRNRLNSTATDLGAAGRDIYFGFGLVNAAAACAGSTTPSDTGTITGTVTKGGKILPKVNITLLDRNGTTVATTKTDSSGIYVFNNVPADQDLNTWYIVQVLYKKSIIPSTPIDLEPGDTVTIDIAF